MDYADIPRHFFARVLLRQMWIHLDYGGVSMKRSALARFFESVFWLLPAPETHFLEEAVNTHQLDLVAVESELEKRFAQSVAITSLLSTDLEWLSDWELMWLILYDLSQDQSEDMFLDKHMISLTLRFLDEESLAVSSAIGRYSREEIIQAGEQRQYERRSNLALQ